MNNQSESKFLDIIPILLRLMKTKILTNSQYRKVAFGSLLIVAGGLVWGTLDLTVLPYSQINFYIGMIAIIGGILSGVSIAVDFQSQLNEIKENHEITKTSIDALNCKLDDLFIQIKIVEIKNELQVIREELQRNYG